MILTKERAAVETLESKGYTWHGGQFWKSPIGKAPAYITGEQSVVTDDAAVESLATDLMKRIDKTTGERHSIATLSSLRVSIVEACRAAMLNRHPVGHVDGVSVNTIKAAPALDSLPKNDESVTTIKPVADLYEVTVPSGRSTTFTVDAAEAKDCADMGWKVQEYVRLERYRDAMLHGSEPVSQHDELPLDYLQGQKDGLEWAARLAEANHPQTADWLYDDPLELAKAIRKGPDIPEAAGNSPVILDGWVACSERMPEEMVSVLATGDWFDYAVTAWDGGKWLDFDYEPQVTHWMPLPAAPQQEVK